jgi:hypothetical protein
VVAHPHPLYGGTMDNAVVRTVVARLLASGAAVLTFDFRGVRRSAGAFDDGAGEQLDLLAAERELVLRFPDLPHWLAGYSFGAFVALARLGRSEAPAVDAVLAIAPSLANRNLCSARPSAPPLALVTGEHDALTPEAKVRRFAAAHPSLVRHEIVAGAGHDLSSASAVGPNGLATALDRTIRELAAGSRTEPARAGPDPGVD